MGREDQENIHSNKQPNKINTATQKGSGILRGRTGASRGLSKFSKQRKLDEVSVFCFIGTNRTGKTSTARNFAIEWKQFKGQQLGGSVFAFDPQNKFKDIADVTVTNFQRDWQKILYTIEIKDGKEIVIPNKKLRNGLFIIDDYRLLQEGHQPDKWLKVLMNFRSEWGLDIIFITHSPGLVLRYLTSYTTDYYIFFTKVKKDGFEEKIPDYEMCELSCQMMNAYVKKNGKGVYPNFPFIHVDTDNDEMHAYNVDAAKMNEAIKDNEKIKELTKDKISKPKT